VYDIVKHLKQTHKKLGEYFYTATTILSLSIAMTLTSTLLLGALTKRPIFNLVNG